MRKPEMLAVPAKKVWSGLIALLKLDDPVLTMRWAEEQVRWPTGHLHAAWRDQETA
jgi:hypothetical protein